MKTIKEVHPVARKDYICDFCGCRIDKGQRYLRQTNEDGYIYDFKCHEECEGIALELGMYQECDDYGLNVYNFQGSIDQYIYDNYYDNDVSDVAVEWQNLTMHEKVLKILDELKTEKG